MQMCVFSARKQVKTGCISFIMFVSLLKAVTVAITGGKNINNVSVMGVRTISFGGGLHSRPPHLK